MSTPKEYIEKLSKDITGLELLIKARGADGQAVDGRDVLLANIGKAVIHLLEQSEENKG